MLSHPNSRQDHLGASGISHSREVSLASGHAEKAQKPPVPSGGKKQSAAAKGGRGGVGSATLLSLPPPPELRMEGTSVPMHPPSE